MKKSTFYFSLTLLAMGGALASCSSDPEFDDNETIMVSNGNFSYNADGVWTQNKTDVFLNIDDYEFSHKVDDYGYVYGFTPSKVADTSLNNPMFEYPYASAAGGGITGEGSQYLVGYWGEYLEGDNCGFNDRTCRIYDEDGDEFQPQSAMVCVNTYLKYAALNGTDFSSEFEPGDWVTLVAHGVHRDGTEAEATFYLINIESNDVESGIQSDWKEFDLTGLGTCTGIYFTMDCTERLKGDYGINIPTYFCLDQLKVKE